MNPNIWICIKRGNKKFLRPMNHANCESFWHVHYEHEAEKVMFEVGDGFEVGNLYDKEEAKNLNN